MSSYLEKSKIKSDENVYYETLNIISVENLLSAFLMDALFIHFFLY